MKLRPTIMLLLMMVCASAAAYAQQVYTITADSTKLTGCDSNELIVENHTRDVKGFLYNKGNGRTVFKPGLEKINDSLYVIGSDSLHLPFWRLGGNAGVNASSQFMGTTDANPLVFRAGNAEAMRIMPSGKVGIGVTNPAVALDLKGGQNITLAEEGQDLTVRVKGPTNWSRGIEYRITDSDGVSNSFGLRLSGYNMNPQLNLLDLSVYNVGWIAISQALVQFTNGVVFNGGISGANHADFNIMLPSNSANPNPTGIRFLSQNYGGTIMSLVQDGHVGIGITTPTAQFHTTGSVRFAGLTNDDTQAHVLVSDANGNLYYRNASSLAMDGGIRSALTVNGPVRARSLTLQPKGPWPDYVFRPDYRLPRLQEVMSYAKEKGHLPGVPSAAEVADHGMDVGLHEAMLLKKIEELTIYAARQQAETDALRQRIAVLEKMMNDTRHK